MSDEPRQGPQDAPKQDDETATQDLQSVLDELEKKKKLQDEAQLDAKIAELSKLVAEADAAEKAYVDAHGELAVEDRRLKNEYDALKAALEAALTQPGIDAVKAIIKAQTDDVAKAGRDMNIAQSAVTSATAAADKAADGLTQAKDALNAWRKPVKSVGDRHKAADTVIKSVQALRNSGRRGEAYWKLELADEAQTPGQKSLKTILGGPIQLVAPDALRAKLEALWKAYADAKTADAAASIDLAKKQADLAEKTKTRDGLVKDLNKTITDALAEHEASQNAA